MESAENFFQISDLKEFLQGSWALERRLDDRRAGQQGRLSGQALFAPLEGDLLYREEGRLTIGEHVGPAEQSYRYSFPALDRATVHFRDGRFFHDLDLSSGTWACTHLCDPDRYQGEFSVLDADTWRVIWHVTGPRKDLTLDSTYRRAL
ncbi:DUF6314 family protein [Pelagibius marinus]|uniref:DUF6314 family protein n=1 Tax=Pelagibius marinus TaxID=2762760 RepID=UPI0018729623|nr:DUF6314 family protein [Pelagibius marinus]